MTSSTTFIVLTVIIFLSIAGTKADTIPVTYLSYVDNALGFYKVIDLTTHKPSSYDSRTLIINQGDTVTWMNDADNIVLTVISDQKLFTDKRLDIRQRSSFLFDEIGTYTFYLREFQNRKQTIIVNEIGEDATPAQITPVETTIVPTPTPTSVDTAAPQMPITTTVITPVATTPPPPYEPPSATQFMSIIVALLAIIITYQVGKDNKEYKEYKEPEEDIKKNEENFIYDIRFSQKISGMLCYLLGILSGIIFLTLSKNRFIRFHAIQSIAVFLFLSTIFLIFMEVPSIGDVFGPVLILISPIIWILLMIKALQGKIFKLPIIGNFAERHS